MGWSKQGTQLSPTLPASPQYSPTLFEVPTPSGPAPLKTWQRMPPSCPEVLVVVRLDNQQPDNGPHHSWKFARSHGQQSNTTLPAKFIFRAYLNEHPLTAHLSNGMPCKPLAPELVVLAASRHKAGRQVIGCLRAVMTASLSSWCCTSAKGNT